MITRKVSWILMIYLAFRRSYKVLTLTAM